MFKRKKINKVIESIEEKDNAIGELYEEIHRLEKRLNASTYIPYPYRWYKNIKFKSREYSLYMRDSKNALDLSLQDIETELEICSASLGKEVIKVDIRDSQIRLYRRLHLGRLDTYAKLQSQGFGTLMIQEIQSYATSNNFWIIDYNTLNTNDYDNQRREKFYKRNGFKDNVWVNHIGSLITISDEKPDEEILEILDSKDKNDTCRFSK